MNSKQDMKVIGLIGGMSWESTAVYYRLINQAVRDDRGGLHSARIIVHSCNFDEICTLQRSGRWDILAEMLADAGVALQRSGAECLGICTNTMHIVAPHVQSVVGIPLLDVRDVLGDAIKSDLLHTVGLLGTNYTMSQPFFKDYLKEYCGLTVLAPSPGKRQRIHDTIFNELCQGIVHDLSRNDLLDALDELAVRGAQGIILGCTELMLAINQRDCSLPLYDSTTLHSRALASHSMNCIVSESAV
jgi:aspartate racemase